MRSLNPIKRHTLLAAAATAGLALAFTARPAFAQAAGFSMTFDEYGKGQIITPTGATVPMVSLGNIVDPFDPGNGLTPLAYDLTATIPGIVAFDGDMNVIEQAATGVPSDLLRWNHGLLLIYSDLPEAGEVNPPPADVGVPTLRQSNLISVLETGPENGTNGVFGYTPTQAQPGFYPAPPGPATYNFISDGQLPEPSTAAVCAMGGGALLARRRHRMRRTT